MVDLLGLWARNVLVARVVDRKHTSGRRPLAAAGPAKDHAAT
jgi:hypothetical protein